MRLPVDLVWVITRFVTGSDDKYWVRLPHDQRMRRIDVFDLVLAGT